MIRKVEIKNFRILKDIKLELKPFNILIGPNATGKSTFLDSISFVSDILNSGIERACKKRSSSFQDLLWDKSNPNIEISMELELPGKIREIYSQKSLPTYSHTRYDLMIGINPESEELQILRETLWLSSEKGAANKPGMNTGNEKNESKQKKIVHKLTASRNDYFYAETTKYNTFFKLDPFTSSLANLPEDEERFPGAVWTKHTLKQAIQVLALNSLEMRKPSHPEKKQTFEMDGSNLPNMIKILKRDPSKRFQNWIGHLRIALPFLKTILVKTRMEDRFLYTVIKDKNDRKIPSWVLSDGTLRILALTLLAYLPDNEGIYLIEEPENGVHPSAVEAIYDSLSSVYRGQVLVATHSPVVLGVAKPEEILCFSRMETGEAKIIPGDQHPALKEWKGSPSLKVLYASGFLD